MDTSSVFVGRAFRASSVTASPVSFFATVQNKLHWAITGQTAAELMGLL